MKISIWKRKLTDTRFKEVYTGEELTSITEIIKLSIDKNIKIHYELDYEIVKIKREL